jgi:hypothetical protein
MDNNLKPSTIMLMAGGAVLFISTFLDWASFGSGSFSVGINAWEVDGFGLLGIMCAAIGIIIGGGVAASNFGNVSMPDQMLGFNHDQVHFILSSFALLITVGFLFRGDVGIGLILGLLASGVMVVGSFMDMQAETGGAEAPPTQF